MVDQFCPDAWVEAAEADACECTILTDMEEDAAMYIEMAAYIIYKATGSRYGPCEITVRPCSDTRVCCARCGNHPGSWQPSCGCRRLSEIILPGPIYSISEILVDGEIVPPENYRVDDFRWLVNLVDQWPRCQDMEAAFDEEGAFTITYLVGKAVPTGAGIVVSTLACELAKAFCGEKDCALPLRTREVVRQGVRVTIDDFEEGRIGSPLIDTWISMVNNQKRPPTIYSPDLPPAPRRTTWVAPPTSP